MPFVINKYHAKNSEKAFLFLMRELGLSQKNAQSFISRGRLFINGEAMTKSGDYIEGDFYFATFEPTTRGLLPIFEEEEFAVFDKPSGVLIHPQNRYTPYSLVDEIKYHFGMDANITHRIDQETSGLVLASKNKSSERTLKMLFESRNIQKTYTALVHGELKDEIYIDEGLSRAKGAASILKMCVRVDKDGKPSQTNVKPLKYFPESNMTLIEAKPRTGRQHQIRVHMFHVKHPIVGDPVYGQSDENVIRFFDREVSAQERIELSGATRLLLHASKLEFNFKNRDFVINTKADFLKEAFESMK